MDNNPLNKLKYLYAHVANDTSATNNSAPGDRLRSASSRLEAAIRAEDYDEVLAVTSQVERELYHLERFIKASEVSVPQLQSVEWQYQAGVQAHQRGWLALAWALENGDAGPCAEAVSCADEGDRLLAEADTEMQTLRQQRPIEG